ncbi:MAG: hypothetical protein CMN28_04825 [Salinisphaeraceae bacterium]|nr:hypothetical protein [Salinisphaeraceae bacterium]
MSESVQSNESSSAKPTDGKDPKSATGKPSKTPAAESAKAAGSKAAGGGRKKGNGDPPRQGKSRSTPILAFIAFLLALLGLVLDFTLWQWGDVEFAEFDDRIDTVERGLETSVQDLVLPRVAKLKSEQSALAESIGSLESNLSELDESLDQTRLQTSDLADKVEGGRTRWKLLEIEGLLLAANERLQLHRDIDGAIEALSVASLRLSRLNDPRLFNLRSQVTEEIAALEALPQPDIQGLAMKLSSLMQQMPQWPLASDAPDSFDKADENDSGFSLPEPSWAHFKTSVMEAFDKLVTVRRSEGQYEPLMPPQQEFFLRQNVLLKLQTARLALLQRNTATYRDSLEESREWLGNFFAAESAPVKNAMEQLERMQRVELAWQEPDISGSLTGLRDYLRKLGRGESMPEADAPAPAAAAKPGADTASAASGQPEDESEPEDGAGSQTDSDAESGSSEDSAPISAPAGRMDDGMKSRSAEPAPADEGAE